MSEVKFCHSPSFDETSVKNIYNKVVKMEGMAVYFPDKFPKGRTCEKEYMYNVWNTMYPESVEMVIEHANKLRYSVEEDKEKSNAITITDEWQAEIDRLPFISKQKGKMSHLLK